MGKRGAGVVTNARSHVATPHRATLVLDYSEPFIELMCPQMYLYPCELWPNYTSAFPTYSRALSAAHIIGISMGQVNREVSAAYVCVPNPVSGMRWN